MMKNRIMIADDSKLNQKLLTAILGKDYDYVYAFNGVEVIDLLDENESIDIILLDINMPIMDGFSVLKALKEKKYIERIPVIVISVENDDDYVSKSYELGATDFIRRPFNSVVVKHRVENTLMLYSKQKKLFKLVENQIYEREKISNSMINIFSNIIEQRNHESGSHTLHVQVITNLLLHQLFTLTDKYNINETDISTISSLSALHDIGKISVPEAILNKPGKLTDEEWLIMKNHTVEGYEILCNANIDQDTQFMETAKAICRWHHEKYDGKGYPDGLKGDEIPISAQVVSMADVYDALTSVRCYKRAFTHEEAINMILNGECGVFNPLLIKCLKIVSEQLKEILKTGMDRYDYHKESIHIANEIFKTNNLPIENTHFILENELLKRDFFEEYSASGIQFEYDMISHKVRLINNYLTGEKKIQIFYTSENQINILLDSDWKKFEEKVKKTTPDNPYVIMKVIISVNGNYRWHLLNAMTIWSSDKTHYITVLGQFTDIHDTTIKKGLSISYPGDSFIDILNSLHTVFSVVRLVDPLNQKVLTMDECGKLITLATPCYKFWNREERCENCVSLKALRTDKWNVKLEVKDGKLYTVLAKCFKIKGDTYILEVVFSINDDEDHEKKKSRRNLMSNPLFADFYKDSLTNAYNRTYFDDFHDNFEGAEGVALIDILGFSKVNDNYGHKVGDNAIAKVSEIINNIIKDYGISIRYGGDEFLLIFEKIKELDFDNILEKINEKINSFTFTSTTNFKLSVRIGGSYNPKSIDEGIDLAYKKMKLNNIN